MSIRLRLTLLYSAILALTLIVSSILLYISVARLTMGVLEDALVDQARLIVASSDFRMERADLPGGRFAEPKTLVQTRNLDGGVVGRSSNLGDAELPLSDAERQRVIAGKGLITTATTDDGRVMIYSKSIEARGDVVGIIQVARPIVDQDQALATLRQALLFGTIAVTVVAFGVGWLLAGIALRPINRITQTARAIGEERNFGRRVAYAGPPDELGQLTTTFNAMLEELEDAFSQEERALKAQRRFAADASHELRTPLTTIRGNIELLLREPPISEEDRVAVVHDIMAETERLIRLTSDLLVLQRADAEWPVAAAPVRLQPLVQEAVRQVHGIEAERAIDASGIPDVAVLGDRDALKQVLLILLDNAIKHTPSSDRIILSASANVERVQLRVRDTGPGIEPELLPHIFERFYRGDDGRNGDGAGLGLAIARALVEAQRGEIVVDSRPGDGTTFLVTLPRAL